MTREAIAAIVKEQRAYFRSGATLSITSRKEALKKLRTAIQSHLTEIHDAVRKDLGKSEFESYMCETGLTLSEISWMLKHMASYAREKTVPTPLAQFCSRSYRKPSPRGVVLIMSPWNYPFMLTMEPLVDAIAAGNTCVLKPSAYSPNTSAVIAKIIKECFDSRLVSVVTGGREENACLLDEHFDHIFFTGSQAVGSIVMEKAAKHLTPVTLELGGKSPCIVDKTADLKLAARRIVFGKYLNCGQTCVAPDYVYCEHTIRDALVKEVIAEIKRQYGSDPMVNADYGKIINEKHFDRVLSLIDASKTVHGGNSDPKTLRIAPTVMTDVTFEDPVMQQEIFGPIMPILTFESIDEAIANINDRPHPLALYYFSADKSAIDRVLSQCGFGGGCVNDTIIHLATSEMPFGGFGESGMGGYHGREGFMAFSHLKSIVDKKTWIDLPMRYQPYTKLNDKLIRMFLK